MTYVLGVILAGGRGSRIGGRIKANIEVAGTPLIIRVHWALAPQCTENVISSGSLSANDLALDAVAKTVPDLSVGSKGPVAGLASVASWATSHMPSDGFVLTAAVDTPFFPSDFVERALTMFDAGTDAVTGYEGDQPFPTNTLWRWTALADLPALSHENALPTGLKNVVPADRVKPLRYAALDRSGCFFNINTQEDLETAERLAGD